MNAGEQAGSNPHPAARAALVRRGLRLEYLTLGWTLLEAAVAVAAGILAGSIALVGFGLDSAVEMFSGAVLLWRLSSDGDEANRERIETRALRLVGISLLAIAAYIAIEAARSLIARHAAEVSYVGMVLAAAALIVMPLLARAKRRVAAQIASRALAADSRQADICAWLSAILLAGLVLNAWLGWWWSDPVAALLMVPLVAKEGLEALRGKCCC
ncbi:MAG TPA: cation transporter [Patescibacteria group bacterium]|nr:cation transporter [Patescibacteria group bacterium]